MKICSPIPSPGRIMHRLEYMALMLRHVADWHGLEPYSSRPCDYRVEDSFSAEQHILYARHALDLHAAGGRHSCQMARITTRLLPAEARILSHGRQTP